MVTTTTAATTATMAPADEEPPLNGDDGDAGTADVAGGGASGTALMVTMSTVRAVEVIAKRRRETVASTELKVGARVPSMACECERRTGAQLHCGYHVQRPSGVRFPV